MKKPIAGILGFICAVSCFCGCAGGGEDNSSAANGNGAGTAAAQPTNPVVVMNGFETQKDLSLLSLYEALGKVKLNNDAAFVKSGKGSAKVIVTDRPYVTGGGTPSLWQETHFDATGEDYSDFSNVMRLSLNVYNAQETTGRIGMQLVYASGVEQTEWFDLEPGKWTTATYYVTRELIPKTVNTRTGKVSYPVTMIRLNFNRPENGEEIYYLDDFCLYRTQKPMNEGDIFALEEDEIAFFDKYWQFRYCRGGGNKMDCVPKLSWVKLPDYTERGGVMKCVLPAGSQNTYSYVEFSSDLFSKFDFSKYVKSDDGYDLCFDVFLPENAPDLTPFMMYLDTYSQTIQLTGFALFDSVTKVSTLKPGWNTVRIPFDTIRNNRISAADPVYQITIKPSFRLAYLTQKSTEATLYIDNFRMEKIGG